MFRFFGRDYVCLKRKIKNVFARSDSDVAIQIYFDFSIASGLPHY